VNSGSKLRRRDFLRLSVITASGATLAACAGSDAFQRDAGAVLGDGTMIFNMYTQPAAASGHGYLYSSDPIVQLDLGQEFPRNRHQLDSLRAVTPQLTAGDSAFGPSLDWAYREYIVRRLSAGDGDAGAPMGDSPAQAVDLATRRRQMQAITPIQRPITADEPRLCLFNVLVALEWLPDHAYMRQLEWAFRRASDFLYDVTDGTMAFGQVVFGGPELMGAADIQIMASNRLLSRSWVSGLHIEHKYMPIRMGRGVWHRNNHVSIAWDEPEAYRTLIHEWGHYALEQRDAYAVPQQLTLATAAGLAQAPDQLLIPARQGETAPFAVIMPHMGVASASVMATTEGNSELLAHTAGSAKHKSDEWDIILRRFPWLNPTAHSLEGPGRMPLPLPRLQRLASLADPAPASLLLRDFPQNVRLDSCWVYLLKGMDTGQINPERVIAQGTIESRSVDEGFRLLGAEPGDTIILIGNDRVGDPLVYRGVLAAVGAGQGEFGVKEWHRATPSTFPAISVVPSAIESSAKMARVSVRVDSAGGQLPEWVGLFPLGQVRAEDARALGVPDASAWSSTTREVPTLDGHVVVRWKDDTLMISSFSQGGGPASSSPFPANPITAGSADGKALLFFYDESRASAFAAGPSTYVNHTPQVDYGAVKVVTTTVHGLAGTAPIGARGLTTAIGLASNAALPLGLAPTLVLYYDAPDERELMTGDLRICRLVDGAWTPLPTYLPGGYPFAVAPLTLETAGSLVAEGVQSRVEYYRVFWLPRSGDARAA
jgi:hypothetical protein